MFVPRDPSSDLKLEVKVGFDVIDIVEINEPKVSMTEFRHILFFTNNSTPVTPVSDIILIKVLCQVALE